MLQEFLHFCEQNDTHDIAAASDQLMDSYLGHLFTRRNHRTEGALSTSHINGHLRCLHLFSEYLSRSEGVRMTVPVRQREQDLKSCSPTLSVQEVKALYEATDATPYGMRDRAMLAVYYGGALRKSEGVNLDLSDVLFERKLLLVRKAKNNHERYVPLTTTALKDIEQWILGARDLMLAEGSSSEALFISERGRRISAGMMYLRLKALAAKAGVQKSIGLHTLRHSIATHLLQKGMELEHIALLLGHRCLDSTQVYTHIVQETL